MDMRRKGQDHRDRGGGWVWGTVCLALLAAGLWVGVTNWSTPPRTESPRPQATTRLALDLPQPRFIGTPIHLKSANLAKPGTTRPELRVPQGLVNVALNKPVTASDTAPMMGELRQVTDGDKDGAEGSYVEIGGGRQWFQVDLVESREIHAIVIWHYHAQARIYRDVVVQVADDAAFAGGVVTLFNNDHDNSSGLGAGGDKEYIDTHEGLVVDGRATRGRYVRLWGNGNTESDLNHCTEIEVYARP